MNRTDSFCGFHERVGTGERGGDEDGAETNRDGIKGTFEKYSVQPNTIHFVQ